MKRMSYLKRLTALCLAIVMVVAAAPSVWAMAQEDDGGVILEGVQGESYVSGGENITANEASLYNYTVPTKGWAGIPSQIAVGDAASPNFDLRDENRITDVRDQNPWGACWSFGVMASGESNLLTRGVATPDLSERQLAWFAYQPVSGGDQDGEGVSITNSNCLVMDQGGNGVRAVSTLSAWRGAVNEAKAPYDNSAAKTDAAWKVNDGLENDYLLKNATFLPNPNSVEPPEGSTTPNSYTYNPDSTAQIKNALVNTGAVAVSFHADTSRPGQVETNNYINTTTWAHYTYEVVSTNHAVTIVGWDDNYSKTNFNAAHQPRDNGAWIVKNSWGESWGNDGYFYISYYDQSLARPTSFEFVSSADLGYDHNYQYDYLGLASAATLSYNGEAAAANMFTAQGNEQLEAVSAVVQTPGSQITVEVYVLGDGEEPADILTKGAPDGTATFAATYNGYYTIELDDPVPLVAGQRYIVAEKIAAGGKYAIPIEMSNASNGIDSSGNTAAGAIRFTAKCNEGESFIIVNNKVEDLTKNSALSGASHGNIMIKAFTTDVAAVTVPTLTKLTVTALDDSSATIGTATDYLVGKGITLPADTKKAKFAATTDPALDPADKTTTVSIKVGAKTYALDDEIPVEELTAAKKITVSIAKDGADAPKEYDFAVALEAVPDEMPDLASITLALTHKDGSKTEETYPVSASRIQAKTISLPEDVTSFKLKESTLAKADAGTSVTLKLDGKNFDTTTDVDATQYKKADGALVATVSKAGHDDKTYNYTVKAKVYPAPILTGIKITAYDSKGVQIGTPTNYTSTAIDLPAGTVNAKIEAVLDKTASGDTGYAKLVVGATNADDGDTISATKLLADGLKVEVYDEIDAKKREKSYTFTKATYPLPNLVKLSLLATNEDGTKSPKVEFTPGQTVNLSAEAASVTIAATLDSSEGSYTIKVGGKTVTEFPGSIQEDVPIADLKAAKSIVVTVYNKDKSDSKEYTFKVAVGLKPVPGLTTLKVNAFDIKGAQIGAELQFNKGQAIVLPEGTATFSVTPVLADSSLDVGDYTSIALTGSTQKPAPGAKISVDEVRQGKELTVTVRNQVEDNEDTLTDDHVFAVTLTPQVVKDGEEDAIIEAGGVVLPIGLTVTVEDVKSGSLFDDVEAAIQQADLDFEKFNLIKMTTEDGGVELDKVPNGKKVTISFAIPAGFDEAKAVIYQVKPNTSAESGAPNVILTRMQATLRDGRLYIDTGDLTSHYVLAQADQPVVTIPAPDLTGLDITAFDAEGNAIGDSQQVQPGKPVTLPAGSTSVSLSGITLDGQDTGNAVVKVIADDGSEIKDLTRIPLSSFASSKTIEVRVSNAAGTDEKTFRIPFTVASTPGSSDKPGSSDSDQTPIRVSGIALSSGTLSPAFAEGTTSYTASVANTVTSIKVTPTYTGDGTVTINGAPVASGVASADIPLSVGENVIRIITGQKTYLITVTRAAAGGSDTPGSSDKPGTTSKPGTQKPSVTTTKSSNNGNNVTFKDSTGKVSPSTGDNFSPIAFIAAGAALLAIAGAKVCRKKK